MSVNQRSFFSTPWTHSHTFDFGFSGRATGSDYGKAYIVDAFFAVLIRRILRGVVHNTVIIKVPGPWCYLSYWPISKCNGLGWFTHTLFTVEVSIRRGFLSPNYDIIWFCRSIRFSSCPVHCQAYVVVTVRFRSIVSMWGVLLVTCCNIAKIPRPGGYIAFWLRFIGKINSQWCGTLCWSRTEISKDFTATRISAAGNTYIIVIECRIAGIIIANRGTTIMNIYVSIFTYAVVINAISWNSAAYLYTVIFVFGDDIGS